MKKFDLIIIGGGRARNLALSAAKRGEKVAIIEKSILGGTCPNRGCIPSKLLIGHAHAVRSIQDSQRHFISSKIEYIDTEKIFETNNDFLSNVRDNSTKGLPEGVTLFEGEGVFLSDHEVQVNGTTLTADKIVVATGTRPRKALHEKAWTSDTIFPLNEGIPKSVTIVGAGFIGVELANFFDAIGVETTLLSRGSVLLNREDEDISAIFKEEFTKNVNVLFDAKISQVTHKDNAFTIDYESPEGKKSHSSEALIEATGRIPNTDNLRLENTSITVNKRGYIKRNEFCETDVKGVYAIGDVASKYALQHIASFEVVYLSKLFYGDEKKPLEYKYVPHAVFSEPEIASIGITEQEAKAQNLDYVTTLTPWTNSAKANAMRLQYQRTKFIVNPKTYEILGCHLIGPESSSVIHQVLAVMQIDNDIRHLANMMYVHPALNEVLLLGARKIMVKID
ncbi:dihydrolipoyl dehydrogenase family protein [Psychroserpens sp.]|uniref:dihydrolipoyl dehydrogenase family protein n=1 Tax=Psychroserpens sp. TaxID=2020870 RepID=UPI0011FE2458|nr:dihydrolipoyl dehydrogenase [Psychroserpens sp.]RZN83364.1 MAG: dihydrolipoyl dehydrogenase [Winogradskyella sp.]MBO6605797.1 dihydrolipoyl dehydrogenase [Psychroserpens sp.]MBO6630237.1 dihydrolipoyl dehydrogenase [Psychroserpens sp.]MBO6652832.1 dihydrolipoyl dehydrogenase [Psychroserpens sp.]MBO6681396.1 dihydrolipoyl dehydrogenase [Psychroserpens sp.]